MKPSDFHPKNFLLLRAKKSASTKPVMNKPRLKDAPILPSAAQHGGDIEEISERLATLADQINGFNAARQIGGPSTRSAGGNLTSFLRTPEGKQNPQTFVRSADPGIGGPSCNAKMHQETTSVFDADPAGRIWPKLSPPKKINTRAFEDKIEEQTAELAMRCIQIADLCNIRQTQANALMIARDEIDSLRKSIAILEQTVTQREIEVDAAAQKLILSENKSASLQAQLETERKESAKLSLTLLDVEATLNDKIVDLAATQETTEQLKAELAAAQAEKISIEKSAEEKENLRHRDELKQQSEHFENMISGIQVAIAERDQKIIDLEDSRAELSARCDDLSKTVASLEGTQQDGQKTIQSQAEYIERLEKKSAAAQAEAIRIAELAEEKANLHYRDKLKQQIAHFENTISQIQAVVAERDRKIMDLEKARTELAARCDGLSKTVNSLEDSRQHAQESLKSQAEYLEFLETVLRVERETSEARINELTEEFQRERLQLQANEHASAEIRKNIVLLLPKLAERRDGHTEAAQDSFIAHKNAA